MSTIECGGVRFWFCTADAPAPSGIVPNAQKMSVRVGVLPPRPDLTVRIRYRRAGGAWMLLSTTLLPHEDAGAPLYFEGVFPGLAPGASIEYMVECLRAGRPCDLFGGPVHFQVEAMRNPRITVDATRSRHAPHAPLIVSDSKPTSMASAPPSADLATDVESRASDHLSRNRSADDGAIREVAKEVIETGGLATPAIVEIARNLAGDVEGANKVLAALNERGAATPLGLARMGQPELAAALESAGVKREDAGIRAAQFKVAVSSAVPSETLAPMRIPVARGNVRSSKQPPAVNTEAVNAAWKENADLDLLRLDISRGSEDRARLKLAGLATAERKALIREIQVRSAALEVAGDAGIAARLLREGITFPGAIAPSRIAEVAGVSLARAGTIRDRSLHHLGRLSQGLITLIDAYRGGLRNTAVGNVRPRQILEIIRPSSGGSFDTLDNLQDLFGTLDTCNCQHCNSVLGPAAYFVDLMHFVESHVLGEQVPEGDPPFRGKPDHWMHLKERRPDLWLLPLTCENTHTEISQLVITNEILENHIAKSVGVTVTPDRSAIVDSVYRKALLSGSNSISQPFHLAVAELDTYLPHFGMDRESIAALLNEPEEDRLRAVLKLTKHEADLIALPDTSAANARIRFGLDVLSGDIPTERLLTATDLDPRHLKDFLKCKFVSGFAPVAISVRKESPESLQADEETVGGLSLAHLDRLHRMIRLQRCVPWTPKAVDGFIAAVGGRLDRNTWTDVGRAVLLQKRFKGTAAEFCALAGAVPMFPIADATADGHDDCNWYDGLFNVPNLMGEDPAYPSRTIRFTIGDTSTTGRERARRLRAGLGLDETELTILVAALGSALDAGTAAPGEPEPGSFLLDGQNLSALYRHVVLARWLRLSIKDLMVLIQLTPDSPDYVMNLSGALAVVRFYDWWQDTPLTHQDLELLLAPAETLRAQVDGFWQSLQKYLQDQEDVALTDKVFTQIKGVSENLSRQIVTDNIGIIFYEQVDGFRVIPTSGERDWDLTAIQDSAIAADAIRDLIRQHHPNERLSRALTEALTTSIDLARVIVAAVFNSSEGLSASDFLPDGPMSESLKRVLLAMLRIHRVGAALHLAAGTLALFVRQHAAFGVDDWAESNPRAIRRFAAVQALIERRYPDDPDSGHALLEKLLVDAEAMVAIAAQLVPIDPVMTSSLVAALRISENPIDALFEVERYAGLARKLGVDGAGLAGIVSDDYVGATAAAAAVKAGFRAKYPDEATWAEKVEPYENRILEEKRDALIDYLLHRPSGLSRSSSKLTDGMPDASDRGFADRSALYNHFLIDPEVDGCFRTSRVVAANSTLQLYVHRIRMNLENDARTGVHVQPSLIPAVEWDWRKGYRIWEANRKVFLWPENYLDPTTRDDMTPLFEDLQSELLQQDITEQTVVDAYSTYLKGLEELANLRYAGSYHHLLKDGDSGEAVDVLYLFGATGGEAPTHYWREIRNLARSQEDDLVSPQFGPWRLIDTKIPVRAVSPIVCNGQLRVFWNEISTIPRNVLHEGESKFIGYSHRYNLKFISLRLDGQWTAPESVSLAGSAPTFRETDTSIDDPLTETSEREAFLQLIRESGIGAASGTYSDPNFVQELRDAHNESMTPRWGIDPHAKTRDGYTLDGFLWERPYLWLDPAYSDGPLVDCAGLLVRGCVDLFDRSVIRADDTYHKTSNTAEIALIAYRDPSRRWGALAGNNPTMETVRGPLFEGVGSSFLGGGASANLGLPSFTLLQRLGDLHDEDSLWTTTWNACPFDYPVAATLALNANAPTFELFKRHWGSPDLSSRSDPVASLSSNAGTWPVAGTPGATIIETSDDLLLLLPNAAATGRFVLHRLGTTLVSDVGRKLFKDGIDGLLATEHQMALAEPVPDVKGPATDDQTVPNPIANGSAYGTYYQEVFQHIPLLIAHHLNGSGSFEQAQRWYHYVFDPTSPDTAHGTDAPETDRNWKYRQFRGHEQVKLRDVLSDAAAIQKYRDDPFNAHAIARLRVSSYQTSVVMRYIDNLLDWADDRFTRFEMESVNEAMMLYVTAAEILGPRPVQLGSCGELADTDRTYDRINKFLSQNADFLLEVAELVPRSPGARHRSVESDIVRLASSGLAFDISGVGGFPTLPGSNRSGVSSSNGDLVGTSAARTTGAASQRAVRSPSLGRGSSKDAKVRAAKPASRGAAQVAQPGHPSGSGGIDGFRVGPVYPVTPEVVRSFSSKQQFRFLGGSWTHNAGTRVPTTLGDRFGGALVQQVTAAFCIPRNTVLEDFWDRVEDRIHKIRGCRDITGRRRAMSLFAPTIDPGLLTRAKAAGITVDEALGAFDGQVPRYRFEYLLQKAREYAGTVQSFGGALQSALERRDGEGLARMQSDQQQQILALTTKAKEWELESATANLEQTERRKTAVENRHAHYAGLVDGGLNAWEIAEEVSTHAASGILGSAATFNMIAAMTGLLPQLGSPFAMTYGGEQLEGLPAFGAMALGQLADLSRVVATSSGMRARSDRRDEEWRFQLRQSDDELNQIEKQIEMAQISHDMAEHAITIHERTIAHSQELFEYHENKFSGLGLFTWQASQLQRTYREAYTMAYRMAQCAEQAYRFERQDYTSQLLSGQQWEPGRAGLLAGNRLTLDLQHLEQLFIETDHPCGERANHRFSLRQWDPMALSRLRHTGECRFSVPELFFDLASPGDYRRRLRSVRVTIPAIAGPYTNVMATVSLDSSRIRYDLDRDMDDAARPRVASISTSSAQNDAGAFEVNFHGEKYAPFEGAGAVSDWTLKLPRVVRMFDYETIGDVLLHLDYTASFDSIHRDRVEGLTADFIGSVRGRLSTDGLLWAFNLKEEFPTEHRRLVDGNIAEITVTGGHLPFFLQTASVGEASLILTGLPDGTAGIEEVQMDGTSLGASTVDDPGSGVIVPLGIHGEGPWKHKFLIRSLPGSAKLQLLFRLQLPPGNP